MGRKIEDIAGETRLSPQIFDLAKAQATAGAPHFLAPFGRDLSQRLALQFLFKIVRFHFAGMVFNAETLRKRVFFLIAGFVGFVGLHVLSTQSKILRILRKKFYLAVISDEGEISGLVNWLISRASGFNE